MYISTPYFASFARSSPCERVGGPSRPEPWSESRRARPATFHPGWCSLIHRNSIDRTDATTTKFQLLEWFALANSRAPPWRWSRRLRDFKIIPRLFQGFERDLTQHLCAWSWLDHDKLPFCRGFRVGNLPISPLGALLRQLQVMPRSNPAVYLSLHLDLQASTSRT